MEALMVSQASVLELQQILQTEGAFLPFDQVQKLANWLVEIGTGLELELTNENEYEQHTPLPSQP